MGSASRLQPIRAEQTPPHDLDAEAALLGAMLLRADTIAVATEHVRADDFYNPAHGHIFRAMTGLYSRSEIADSVTVADELRRGGELEKVGGGPALITLMANAPGISGALRYARIVSETARLRHLAHVGRNIGDLAYDWPQNVDETHDKAEAMLFALRREQSNEMRSVASGLDDWLSVLSERIERKGEPLHPTGWRDLDKAIGGLHPSRLMIVGARPGVGKTSWSNELTLNVAKRGAPVLVVSVEMSYEELLTRYVAHESQLPGSAIGRGAIGQAEMGHITKAIDALELLPIEIIDITDATLMSIRAAARRVTAAHGSLGLIVVDYLQLMTGTKRNNDRRLEVEEVARGLKLLARELNVPLVALSQLNRGLETRQEKHPCLADLRESGEIENAADVVMFLHRDGYFKPDADPNTAEFIVAKNRHGPLGKIEIRVNLRTGHWRDTAQQRGEQF